MSLHGCRSGIQYLFEFFSKVAGVHQVEHPHCNSKLPIVLKMSPKDCELVSQVDPVLSAAIG
jgi:hypothetical protein